MLSRAEVLRPERALPYLRLLRADHWFKNAFMLLGVVLALSVRPDVAGAGAGAVATLLAAFAATCIIASSNYVLNEFLDAPSDRLHPVKRHRPAARADPLAQLRATRDEAEQADQQNENSHVRSISQHVLR